MSKRIEDKENGLFNKLPVELIAYAAVYLNLAELFAFRRVCRDAQNLNVSYVLNNILSKPLRLKTGDPGQFVMWKIYSQALTMQFLDTLSDFNLEQKIVFRFEPRSYQIPPETLNEISVNLFKSLKPALEEKRKKAEEKFCCLIM